MVWPLTTNLSTRTAIRLYLQCWDTAWKSAPVWSWIRDWSRWTCWRLQCSVCSLLPLTWEMDLLTTSSLQNRMPPDSITESVLSFTEKLESTVFEADKQIDWIYILCIKCWNKLDKIEQKKVTDLWKLAMYHKLFGEKERRHWSVMSHRYHHEYGMQGQ